VLTLEMKSYAHGSFSVGPSADDGAAISLNWASEVLSEHLAQRRDVHHLFGQKTLQLRVLIHEPLQKLGLTDLNATIT
jgi:hypothetical protein